MNFDRVFYLANNPDVTSSGMDPEIHYYRCGRFEGRKCCEADYSLEPKVLKDLFRDVCSDIHPDDEMFKVIAHNSSILQPEALYLSTGEWIYDDVIRILEFINFDFQQVHSLLDFACGYGRVTRFWLRRFKPLDVWAADVQHSAVRFLSQTLGVHGVYPSHVPSAKLFSRKFDLISVISLFSHLPEHRTKQWLACLVSALEPKGTLVLSFHGVNLLSQEIRTSMDSGILFAPRSESANLPSSEYGVSYLSHDYLISLVDGIEGANLIGIYPRGLCGFQDLAVIMKSA